MKKTTIVDIAKRMKISASTVSRALSDHSEVSQKTKEKVKKIAREMNYQPNIVAQSLKRGHSKIIGVLVPQVRHMFFAEIMAGISDVADEAGYNVLICQSNENYEKEVKNVETLIQQQIAGLLVSVSETTTNFDHFNLLKNNKIPLVFFDRVCEEVEASQVGVNDYESAFEAVEYLIQRGYKRIAHLAGFSQLPIARERMRGYRDALAKYHYSDDLVVENGLNEEDGAHSFLSLYNNVTEKPDAIFAVTDPVAIGAYQEIKKMGLKIPDDIALMGFSNNPIASLIEPPMSTVDQPAYEIGKEAVKLLLEHIAHKNKKIARKILPTKLIIREST